MDKTPVETETGSEPVDFYPESSRSLDSLREMRLMALLHDMITAEDGAKAAKALGVSYRTVSRTVESGRLSERMAAMLERHLLLGGGIGCRPAEGAGRGIGEAVGGVGGGTTGWPQGLSWERSRLSERNTPGGRATWSGGW